MDNRAGLIADIRSFNRFYTRRIGLLQPTMAGSPFTLSEMRVLFELGRRAATAEATNSTGLRAHLAGALQLNIGPAASEIAEELRVDPAYLTRILRKLGDLGLTHVQPDPADGRRRILSLTEKGEAILRDLQAATNQEIGEIVAHLDDRQAAELSQALHRAAALLGDAVPTEEVTLRPHEVGDVGWAIERQSKLYADEFGWDPGYEALVCEIGGSFLRDFKPGREFCWVAERGGERLGLVFLVQRSERQAQLRMLHVEPSARGAGVGRMLVEECIRFARTAGYDSIMLWTHGKLGSARRLYDRTGFRLVESERKQSFGQEMDSEIWELDLREQG